MEQRKCKNCGEEIVAMTFYGGALCSRRCAEEWLGEDARDHHDEREPENEPVETEVAEC